MSGIPSPKQSSSSGSAASFIKVVEQLYHDIKKQIQSDDEEILAKKMQQLQNTFPILKKINKSLSNQQKLSFFMRDNNFKQKIFEKLVQTFGIEKVPTIKVNLYTIRYRSTIQQEFDETDIVKIFDRFGRISFVYVHKITAYIQFQSIMSSYLAIKTLNQFQIVRDSLCLAVKWCRPQQQVQAEQLFYAKFTAITTPFGSAQKNQKLNCKYNIHLPCPSQFKIAQKIIGPKGNNMKKIFEQISNRHQALGIKEIQKNLKMRLRGKGSGYKEGPNSQQSDEILNFCISSVQKSLYNTACQLVENILKKLATDFKFQFQRAHKRSQQGTVYKNYVMQKQLKLEQISSALGEFKTIATKKLTEKEIEQEINNRNRARRAGKYKEADLIREKLKLHGVILTDSTGKKNTYLTTWKYID